MPPNLTYEYEYEDELPVIPVSMRFAGAEVAFSAMIDTGAEVTIVDELLASQLGLDFNDLPRARVGGIGGGIWEARTATVDLFPLFMSELEVSVSVAFVTSLNDSFPGLIGRDVLEYLDFGLSHSERLLYLGRASS